MNKISNRKIRMGLLGAMLVLIVSLSAFSALGAVNAQSENDKLRYLLDDTDIAKMQINPNAGANKTSANAELPAAIHYSSDMKTLINDTETQLQIVDAQGNVLSEDSEKSLLTLTTDRTNNMGILISAWQMDDHGITPAQCRAMLMNIASAKGVNFAAVKITYGYDPDAYTPQYIAGRIHTWVDYFDDYYNNIYVASRTVFHAERQLTNNERDTYYNLLAGYLNSHNAVKGFFGEEEPEASQVDPYNGDPEGNNLAYTDMQDMMDYVEGLHDTWHTYSSIPFSFESIPPAYYSWDNGVYTVHGDPSCWFDTDGYPKDDYWGWIFDNQDFFAIDEWRNHWGSEEWSYIMHWYNLNHDPDRKIVIGETFNLDVAETEELMDQFKYSGTNELQYAFWWMLCGSEYVPSENPSAPEPYIYFDGGYKGHCWAFCYMQTKSYNGIPENGIASAMTYSEDNNDIAVGQRWLGYYSGPHKDFSVSFNIDVSNSAGTGGYETVLACWAENSNRQYSISARYIAVGEVSLVFRYVNNYGATSEYVFANAIVPNCWNWAKMHVNNNVISFEYGYEDDSGTLHPVYPVNTCTNGYTGNVYLAQVTFGAFGGAKVKLYIGHMYCQDFDHGVWGNWFEDWYNGASPWYMNGWTLYFDEPSAVRGSDLIVPSNGAWWMIARLRYSVDY